MNKATYNFLFEIGDALREYRFERGLTMNQIAERCDLSESSVMRIESGMPTRVDSLLSVLNAVGASVEIDIGGKKVKIDFE